jgi:hypothetical protein
MYRLLINLYEFGQFLRILLWIFVPIVVISMLVTTWLHYRRKGRTTDGLLLSGVAGPSLLLSAAESDGNGNGQVPRDEPLTEDGATLEPEERENIYKGILWMKAKFEQYRDMADRRYEEVREQLEIKNRQIALLEEQLGGGRPQSFQTLEVQQEQLRARFLLEEKQAYIDQLEGQLVAERRKIEELVVKLQASSQQLLTIYEELDRSLKPADGDGESLSSPIEP